MSKEITGFFCNPGACHPEERAFSVSKDLWTDVQHRWRQRVHRSFAATNAAQDDMVREFRLEPVV